MDYDFAEQLLLINLSGLVVLDDEDDDDLDQ